VVGGLHFGQLHDGPFECLHIGAGMAHEAEAQTLRRLLLRIATGSSSED